MGQINLSDLWKPDLAKEKFTQVKKEFNRSEYGPIAQTKIKAIDDYNGSINDLKVYEAMESETLPNDSAVIDSVNKKASQIKKPYEELLYHIGDLQAFSFDRLDTGIVYFKRILERDSTSKFYPKALFTLSLIYEQKGDTTESVKYKKLLQSDFPLSDYTTHLFKGNSKVKKMRNIDLIFSNAESLWATNKKSSMNEFKKVIKTDSLSEVSAAAAYFLGYQYDYTFVKLDSALKYYQWLDDTHPRSEQNNFAKSRARLIKQLVQSTENDSTATVN